MNQPRDTFPVDKSDCQHSIDGLKYLQRSNLLNNNFICSVSHRLLWKQIEACVFVDKIGISLIVYVLND